MRTGDVVTMPSWTHWTPNAQAKYAAPKDRVGVFIFLGTADKKALGSFDVREALRSVGWIIEDDKETGE